MLQFQAIKGLLDDCTQHEIASQLLNNWVSLSYMAHHMSLLVKISKFQQFLKENSLSETISRRTCHDTTPHHRPSGTKRIFKMNIGGNLALHYTTKCPIWPAQPFLVDHCIHAQVEVTATTRTALNLSLLNVEYTDLPCLEKKRYNFNPV